MFEENIPSSAKRFSILRKTCPICGRAAQAEAQLPISAGLSPPEIDLDRPSLLGEKLGMGQLLALVEVIPYKQFHCAGCGHDFKLASQIAKGLVLDMVSSMQPVAPPPKKGAAKAKPKAPHKPPTPAAQPRSSPSDGDWETEAIDPG